MTIFRYTPCALALASCSMAAWAEAPPVELETVVVVANKQRESVERTAASVSAADAGQIEDWQATTLQPVLRAMPNVELGGGRAPTVWFPPSGGLRAHRSPCCSTARGRTICSRPR